MTPLNASPEVLKGYFMLCIHSTRYWHGYRLDLRDKVAGSGWWILDDPVTYQVLANNNIYADGTIQPSEEAETALLGVLIDYAREKEWSVPLGMLNCHKNSSVDTIDTTRAGWTMTELKAVGELAELGEQVMDLVMLLYHLSNPTEEQRARVMTALGSVNRQVEKCTYNVFKAMMRA